MASAVDATTETKIASPSDSTNPPNATIAVPAGTNNKPKCSISVEPVFARSSASAGRRLSPTGPQTEPDEQQDHAAQRAGKRQVEAQRDQLAGELKSHDDEKLAKHRFLLMCPGATPLYEPDRRQLL
jgi:hypothetical protein